jgi:CubicO group peptidase (beta-lactamase class C family)
MRRIGMSACIFVLLLLLPTLPVSAAEEEYYPTSGWRTSTPEEQGMASSKLQEMKDYIRANDVAIDGVAIIRHGYLIWEDYPNPQYTATDTHRLYSVTKSFTSCLIGIAIDKGHIQNVNQTMISFFPDRTINNLDERKQKITVENLLMMRSGMRWDESTYPFTDPRNDIYHILHGDGLQWCLDLEVTGEPGVTWHYNTGASHILSGIVTATTGTSTLHFAEENLFKPLGITRYAWSEDGAGTTIGGFDLQLSPRDMAKFGYLYLHGGKWDGKQVVSEAWVKKSTTTLTKPYASLGYGYQWWTTPSLNMYACRGLYNQMIYVLPDQDLVVAITGDMKSGGTDSYITSYVLTSIEAYVPEGTTPTQSQAIPAFPAMAIAAGVAVAVIILTKTRRKEATSPATPRVY